MTAYTEPHEFMAGYSTIPLRVYSSEVLTSEDYKYLINILYNNISVSAVTATSIQGDNNVYSLFTFATDHEFSIGDSVYFNSNNQGYDGIYYVKQIPSTSSVVTTMSLGVPVTGSTSLSNIIRYKMSPDLQLEAKVDLSNTIKDFVTQDLRDVSEIYEGDNTLFEYDILASDEKRYVFTFEDNLFISGSVAFHNTTFTSGDTANIPFEIGDSIVVNQNLAKWDFLDNFFHLGELAFTSTTVHNFRVGQQVEVTGQITEPYYNGPTTVSTVIDNYSFSVNKTFFTATPVEGGSVFGVPRPEYNTVGNIIDIYYDNTYGAVIVTDIGYTDATQPIGGTIKYADDILSTYTEKYNITGLTAYNAYLNRLDYSVNGFDSYVIQSRSASLNKFASILSIDSTKRYRVEQSTKGFLLSHSYQSNYAPDVLFGFFNSNGTGLSTMVLNNVSNNLKDFYVPYGIDQLLGSSNLTLISGSHLSAITSNIAYYTVSASDGTTVRSQAITFELNDDCSRYELYQLMWKDRYGSWISYPFKYISENLTEFERKTFYQNEGNWDLTNNTFGFDSYDRGEKTYYSRSRDKMILNSGWVEEYENQLIKDLLSSSAVYVQTPDNKLIGCTIVNNDYKFFKKDSDYLFNYQLEIRLANNEYRF